MKNKTNLCKFAILSVAGCAFLGLSSCLPLAAGAAAGYIAHEEGYRVTNPIKKVE